MCTADRSPNGRHDPDVAPPAGSGDVRSLRRHLPPGGRPDRLPGAQGAHTGVLRELWVQVPGEERSC